MPTKAHHLGGRQALRADLEPDGLAIPTAQWKLPGFTLERWRSPRVMAQTRCCSCAIASATPAGDALRARLFVAVRPYQV